MEVEYKPQSIGQPEHKFISDNNKTKSQKLLTQHLQLENFWYRSHSFL